MINWNKTKEKYGYDKPKRTQLVIVECDVCYVEYSFQYYNTKKNIEKNNKYICLSCCNRLNYNNKNYVKKQKDGVKNWAKKADFRTPALKRWENKNYRDRMVSIRRKNANDVVLNHKHKINTTNLWKDNDYRTKVTASLNKDETKEKQAIAREQQSGRESGLEKLFYSILDDVGVEYAKQKQIGPWSFDCVIPRHDKPDLLVEYQGDYWHSLKDRKTKDRSKASYITNNFPHQYELKYLWEHEFKCKDKIIELIKYWMGITEIEITDFDFKDVKIKKIKSSDCKPLLSKYHYLPNAGRGGITYGAHIDDELMGVCVFSSVGRQNIAIDGYKQNEVRELSRLCIHPRYQKHNFASWFISRCIKLLDIKYKCIISYCDTTFNHNGSVYKACNFVQDSIVKPDYWYVGSDGWTMHKKTLYNHAIKMNMKEKDYAESNGYIKVYGKEKLRFIYKR